MAIVGGAGYHAAMVRVRAVITASLLAASAAASAGCQTFIGVEDVSGHLPRLDGTYLLAIHRVRTQVTGEDVIRLRCLAALDTDTRTLDLSFAILTFRSDAPAAEGSISGVEFPPDATTASFAFNLQIPSDAVDAPAPTGTDTLIDVPDMLLRAEAEYSFCGRPATTAQTSPTFGTVMVAAGGPLPTGDRVDTDCDEP